VCEGREGGREEWLNINSEDTDIDGRTKESKNAVR
jgi:hypothetical protein